ncbi:unnamed protein product [Urochloa humidicola]
MASSWSSSRSTAARGRQGEGASSPIPYREGPLEYMPPTMCKCGVKAARWISWSNENPARRYYTCFRRREGGCNFWVWCDPPPSLFLREVLVDLRDVVTSLKKENRDLMNRLAAVELIEHEEKGSDTMMLRVSKLEKELVAYKRVIQLCVVVVVLVCIKWLVN